MTRNTSLVKRLLTLSMAMTCLAGWLLATEQVSPWEWKGVARIVAVGDVHGTLHSVEEILRKSKLVDDQLRWQGGDSHIIFCGDLVGRGFYEKDILDLIKIHSHNQFSFEGP